MSTADVAGTSTQGEAMPIIHHQSGATSITGKASMEFYRAVHLLAGLRLEMKGLRTTRGVSCYAIIKRECGFNGDRAKVLAQFQAYVDAMRATVDIRTEGKE